MRAGQTVIGLDKLSEQSGVCSLPEHWCAWDKNILSKDFRRKRKVARQHLLTSGINLPPLGIITDNSINLDRSLYFDWNYTNSHWKSSEIEPNVTLGWLSSCQLSDSSPSISVGWSTECIVQQLSSHLISFNQSVDLQVFSTTLDLGCFCCSFFLVCVHWHDICNVSRDSYIVHLCGLLHPLPLLRWLTELRSSRFHLFAEGFLKRDL